MSNLFSELGGAEAVDAVVETFYRHVLSDERINRFFDDIDMDRQIGKQKAFLTMAFGGPVNYSGHDMRNAHTHLVKQGLNDNHFNAVVDILSQSLREHNVSEPQINQVKHIAESVRSDVLGR